MTSTKKEAASKVMQPLLIFKIQFNYLTAILIV